MLCLKGQIAVFNSSNGPFVNQGQSPGICPQGSVVYQHNAGQPYMINVPIMSQTILPPYSESYQQNLPPPPYT